jgi:hypothetical protein
MNLIPLILGVSSLFFTPQSAVLAEEPPERRQIIAQTSPQVAETPSISQVSTTTLSTTTIAQMIRTEAKKQGVNEDIMVGIAICESNASSTVVNNNPKTKDHSVGVFQINLYGANAKSRPSEDWLKIPENNIAYAFELYKKGGFNHWKNCYNKYQGAIDP